MTTMDHDRCSELLGAYVRGELDASERDPVDAHLATCAECRAERAGLVALLGSGDTDPLTEMERARLRRAVLAAGQPDEVTPVAETPPSWAEARGNRLLQVLGTAALLVMIGGFIYATGLTGGGMGGMDSAEDGSGGGGDEAPAATSDEALEAEAGGGTSRSSAQDLAGGPRPTFRRSLGEITGRRLNQLGREGLPLVMFSRAYGVEDVSGLQADFRDELAAAADPHSDTVRECSDLVTEAFPASLPAYGALAELDKLDGDEILVLAFAWTDQPSGPLDQSMVWGWPLGNCDQPVEYFKNVIRPQR